LPDQTPGTVYTVDVNAADGKLMHLKSIPERKESA